MTPSSVASHQYPPVRPRDCRRFPQAEAVGRAVLAGIDEEPAIGELGAIGDDVEDVDLARHHRLDDVDPLLVRREAEPVRPLDRVEGRSSRGRCARRCDRGCVPISGSDCVPS